MSTRATKYYWFGGAVHVYYDYADMAWWFAGRVACRVYLSVRLWQSSEDES